MDGGGDHLQLASDVDRVDLVEHVRHPRVGLVRAPEHSLDLVAEVGTVELGDMDERPASHPQGPGAPGWPQGPARPPFPR